MKNENDDENHKICRFATTFPEFVGDQLLIRPPGNKRLQKVKI